MSDLNKHVDILKAFCSQRGLPPPCIQLENWTQYWRCRVKIGSDVIESGPEVFALDARGRAAQNWLIIYGSCEQSKTKAGAAVASTDKSMRNKKQMQSPGATPKAKARLQLGQTSPEKREKQMAKAKDEDDIQIIETEPKEQAGKDKSWKSSVSEVMFCRGFYK
jgi:hypothetical protein